MSFTVGALFGMAVSTVIGVVVILHYKWQEYRKGEQK